MSLPHGLLGLLMAQDSTGYDLSKMFQDSLNFFWNAQVSQIYRELKRMQESGWVVSSSIIQEGRPNKRLYSITETGKTEFRRWLYEFKFNDENVHSAFLLRLFFSSESDPDKTIKLLREFMESYQNDLQHMKAISESIDIYTQNDSDTQHKIYRDMTVKLGIVQAEAALNWCRECIIQLENLKIDGGKRDE